MKNCFLCTAILFCLFANIYKVNAQFYTYVDSLKIFPKEPVRNDTVRLALYLTVLSDSKRHYLEHTLNGNNIDIRCCFTLNGATTVTYFNDTLLIGPLTDGTYTINFKSYTTINTDSCADPGDSTMYYDTFVVQAPASISIIKSENFTLYPSPAYEVLHIRNATGAILQKAIVFDTHGSLQKQYSGKEPLDISILPPGMYFLCLDTDKGRVMKRFVKE
jgi:hypothetical protein